MKIVLSARAGHPNALGWATIGELIAAGFEPYAAFREHLIAVFTFNGQYNPQALEAVAKARALTEAERNRQARRVRRLFTYEKA